MEIDITELEKESRRRISIINGDSIRVGEGKLSFIYTYLSHLPNPFDGYYDESKKEFHVIINRDSFTMGSQPLEQSFELPRGVRKVRVDYIGKNLDSLSYEERIEHFFPKLKSGDGERHRDGLDISGYDGWLTGDASEE